MGYTGNPTFGLLHRGKYVGEPIVGTKSGVFSSGSLTLDSMIGGGLKKGSLNLIEVSNDVSFDVTSLFLRTALSNFINNGHRVLFVPFIGSAESQLEEILPNISKETVRESIVSLPYLNKQRKNIKDQGLTGDATKDFDSIDSKIEELSEDSDKPVLVVFSQDAVEGIYGVENVSKHLANSIALSKNLAAIQLQLCSPGSVLLPELKALCDSNLRIEMLHGTPLAYSIKPLSVLHGMMTDESTPGRLSLVPIV